ncbi:hypothetical protein LMG9964_02560 [Paraburkholderia phenoliruptrix]|uniref:Uncharacterized protein n=1 Tax=Paraburkholderia phenoliruptrix TaxID=252970 RepID=A0A6J5K5F1_9BURK|nr:hypothetical protein [Paraburkholderia phenoliruptrix]CAB4048917.1 hypothetical protein LMG9964_02560 [Paraburkholderia phenoliruptrix]
MAIAEKALSMRAVANTRAGGRGAPLRVARRTRPMWSLWLLWPVR